MQTDHREPLLLKIEQLETRMLDAANQLMALQGSAAFVLRSRHGNDFRVAVGTPDDIRRLLDTQQAVG